MGIAFSDYLSHDSFPLFIVTVWMHLRQINVLSLSCLANFTGEAKKLFRIVCATSWPTKFI